MADTPELDLTDVGDNEDPTTPPEETPAEPVLETPPETEPAPETLPVDPEPEFAPEPTMAERLTEMGFEGVNDDDAAERLIQAYQQRDTEYREMQGRQGQLEQMAKYGQQYIAQQSTQQPPAPAAAPEADKHWWTPPSFDPEQANRYRQVSVDDAGNQSTSWRDDTPAEVRASSEAYQAYSDKWAADLTYRPNEVLPPIIEQIVAPMIQAAISRNTESAYSDAFYERIEREQGHRLYELDPVSQRPAIDPVTGEQIFSDYGRQMQQGMSRLRESGVSDPETQWNLANDMVTANVARATEAAVQVGETAVETAARRRKEHISRATGSPARGGSVPPVDQEDPPRQNRVSTPGQQLLVDLAEAGVITT